VDGAEEHDEYEWSQEKAKTGKNGFSAVSPGNRRNKGN
jgi:hypothetical protein